MISFDFFCGPHGVWVVTNLAPNKSTRGKRRPGRLIAKGLAVIARDGDDYDDDGDLCNFIVGGGFFATLDDLLEDENCLGVLIVGEIFLRRCVKN